MKPLTLARFFLLAALAFFGVSSQASTIFLAGSEAASFHHIDAYTNPVFKQLEGTSTLPVLVINNFGATAGFYADTGGVAVTYMSPTEFSTATLSNYSTMFFASPGTCCGDPYALLGSRGADVAEFVASGGSLYVEDYQGNEAWNAILGLTVPASAITSGATSPDCLDPGLSTPAGLAFGFAPSYSMGCFQHQTYDPEYWAKQGYFALQVSGTDNAQKGHWITMATGFVEPGTVPEPGLMALLGFGLLGLLGMRRR
ncbi:PEP-CTERM sorting domain-containing protein [Niveibacterium terrae]|uniref:PEP-CTERM sorting domain-containing protein n=1 Tax=Niveibacterium terrae TaxID=3373598 RepID=UPI003A8DFAE8